MPSSDRLIEYLDAAAYGKRADAVSTGVKHVLRGLSGLYRGILWAYLLPFRLGVRKAERLSCPVISVGNITVGGTGKTPIVRFICERLIEKGFKPAVLSYGYGGRYSGRFGVVSDRSSLILSAEDAGDEPRMLAELLKSVPVLIGKDRRVSGKAAIEQFGADVLVLDDGFQVWKLQRDLDIVLLSGANPLDNGYTLPAGRLRESPSSLKRAGCIILTGCRAQSDEAVRAVGYIAPGVSIFKSRVKVSSIQDLSNQESHIQGLQGRKVLALSSIGNPAGFTDTLGSLNVKISASMEFGDHHRYSNEDAADIDQRVKECGADLVATTAKDAVKLAGLKFTVPVVVVEIVVEMENEEEFLDLVIARAKRDH